MLMLTPISLFDKYEAQPIKGKVRYIEDYSNLVRLKDIMTKHKASLIILIKDRVYIPDNVCTCNRNSGEDDLNRNNGFENNIRNSDGMHHERNAGNDSADRSNGGDSIGRKWGSDNWVGEKRREETNNKKSDFSRAYGSDNLGRINFSENENRNAGSFAIGRLDGNESTERKSGNDSLNRNDGKQTLDIYCMKLDEECKFELVDVNPNSQVKIYYGFDIPILIEGTIIQY